MTPAIPVKTFVFFFACAVLFSCAQRNPASMTKDETKQIINEVKGVSAKLTDYTQKAELDSFLSVCDNSNTFLAFSNDGIIRNFEEFKKVCTQYYGSLEKQQVNSLREQFHVLDFDYVMLAWTGNITAQFKNGDIMKMTNYSITFVFKKIDGQWKVIHSHESSLSPEIIKKM